MLSLAAQSIVFMDRWKCSKSFSKCGV